MAENKTLAGGDSATPKPDRYEGKKIWGVYVAGATFHVWTKEEVAALAPHGVEGVLPIVVPPQNEEWWQLNHGYADLELLVRQAIEWGIPHGSPLCLDVEEGQSSRFGAAASDIARAWAVACRTHELIPWAYGAASFLDKDLWSNRWLAEWPNVVPVDPDPPTGYRAWQYHGNDNGIDHDVFLADEIFLSPELTVVKIDEKGATPLDVGPVENVADVATSPAAPVAEGATEPGTPNPDVTVGTPAVPAPSLLEEALALCESLASANNTAAVQIQSLCAILGALVAQERPKS